MTERECGAMVSGSNEIESCGLPAGHAGHHRTSPRSAWDYAVGNAVASPTADRQVCGSGSGTGPEFAKADAGKSRLDLLPAKAVLEVGRVLGYGAQKYAAGNWRHVDDLGRYVAAAQRHVMAYVDGERCDPDTGLHHLAHAATSLMFIVDLELARGGSAGSK